MTRLNETLFRTLLLQSEGPELDFKRDQYAFIGANDLTKSKLLKDILTFANSWRLGNAYILIGVEDLGTGDRNPRGIPPGDHIDDASLQQFVNSKTNREVKFSYQAFHYHGNSLGILTIPKQRRPLYASKDFGIVKASEVYYRRGSSSAIASPADIYQMGLDDEKDYRAIPVVRVELADLARRIVLGTSAQLKTIHHQKHHRTDYPDEQSEDRGFLSPVSDDVNRDYWRELADYTLTNRSLASIGFAATNAGGELAKNVRLEISQPKNSGVVLMVEDGLPGYPRYNRHIVLPNFSLHSMLNPPKGVPKLLDHDDRWTLLVDFGDIQPKATSWAANPVYVSARTDGAYLLSLRTYADNLSEPQESEIQLDFAIEKRPPLKLEELLAADTQYWKEREELDE